jgi:hypothetical protein
MTFLFLTGATALHCLQNQLEGVGVSDNAMFWAWSISWIVANSLFLVYAMRVQGREVNLVRQLGLTRTADAGSGVQVRSAAISGAAAEDSGILNQGMGGITDVRAMLREQKRHHRKKHLREEEVKLRKAEKKAVAVAAFTNPLDDAEGIDKEVE